MTPTNSSLEHHLAVVVLIRRVLLDDSCRLDKSLRDQLLHTDILEASIDYNGETRSGFELGYPKTPYYQYLGETIRRWTFECLGDEPEEMKGRRVPRLALLQPFQGFEEVPGDSCPFPNLEAAVKKLAPVIEQTRHSDVSSLIDEEYARHELQCEVPGCWCDKFQSTPFRPTVCWCTHTFVVHGGNGHSISDDPFGEKLPSRTRDFSLERILEEEKSMLESSLPTEDCICIPQLQQISDYYYRKKKEESIEENLCQTLSLTGARPSGNPDEGLLSEIHLAIAAVLQTFGSKGIVRLLGCRSTVGTLAGALPPPLSRLLRAFNQPHRKPAATSPPAGRADDAAGAWQRGRATPPPPAPRLTVGARALAKHAQRCSAGWWGACAGPEAEKNAAARRVLRRLLDGAAWVNVHRLPAGDGGGGGSGRPVVEVRVAEGYGARWGWPGGEWRGFLEPQMEGGHEASWRH